MPGGGVGYGYGSLGGVGSPFNVGKSPAISHLKKPIQSFIPVARISDMLLNPRANSPIKARRIPIQIRGSSIGPAEILITTIRI